MGKNWRLFLTFCSVVFLAFYINQFSNFSSQRELLLKNLFSIEAPLLKEWTHQDQLWTFYYEAKSLINKNSVWFVLKSTPLSLKDSKDLADSKDSKVDVDKNKDSFSIVNQKEGQILSKNMEVFQLDSKQKPKFELKKISSQEEALFFVKKRCENDFCSEDLKVFSLGVDKIIEIGNIPLSASNLLTCKKEKLPCFEYFGQFTLLKNSTKSHHDIQILFRGYEEDSMGKPKPIPSELYSYENGKYQSETLKNFHGKTHTE
ncbi:MAG: hypothetical protein J0M15_00675 [Deltaproteobacteria bacterium]|nr:hypothetical protein [Deltaproteobacteria bacterium]